MHPVGNAVQICKRDWWNRFFFMADELLRSSLNWYLLMSQGFQKNKEVCECAAVNNKHLLLGYNIPCYLDQGYVDKNVFFWP